MTKLATLIVLTLVCWSVAIYLIVRAVRKGVPGQRTQTGEGVDPPEWGTIVARSLVLLLSPVIVATVALAIWSAVDDKEGGSFVDGSVILGLSVLLGPLLALFSFLDGAADRRTWRKRRS